MKKLLMFLCIFISLLSSCTSENKTKAMMHQVDSLVEEYPDSALKLLKRLPIQELSRKEAAHYALILAHTTDRLSQSLLPCDSLLNIALHHYEKNEKERAIALLYKGRLETEIGNSKESIMLFQEAYAIIKHFPNELKTKNLICSSLGNGYFDAGFYDEAGKIYHELYRYCLTDKDKVVALNDLSVYYAMKEENDSAIIMQRKALEYSKASEDPALIIMSKHNLSIRFESIDKLDSAIFYAQSIIDILPQEKIESVYYYNLGNLLLEKGDKEAAGFYLNKCLEDSITDALEKAVFLKSLYEYEKLCDNYEVANQYLEEYADILDSLYTEDQMSGIKKVIYEYKTKMQVQETQIEEQRIRYFIIGGFILICFFIALFYQYHFNRKKRVQLQYQYSLQQTQEKLASLQAIIESNEAMIDIIQQKHNNLEIENKIGETLICEREKTIERLKKEKLELRGWLFTQSNIYKKVQALSKQEVTDKKELKVLNIDEQKKLKDTIFGIFTDYISLLPKKYPRLTEDDLLYLCLQETQLEPQTIAFCFGYSDTHPINQRKLRIKSRMVEDN